MHIQCDLRTDMHYQMSNHETHIPTKIIQRHRELWMKNIEQNKLFTRILEISWSFKILVDFNLDMRV